MNYSKAEILAGLNSLNENNPFQEAVKNIKPGKFKRDKNTFDYKCRIIYTETLRKYVYHPSLMNEILMSSELKEVFFRTFGYKGQINFTIYPDAWLRDLPLLEIGPRAYIGDGIVLGTNQVSRDQNFITVGKIRIGTNTIIDQRVAIGYSTDIGADCALGFDSSVGIKSKIGDRTIINEKSIVAHGVTIGRNVKIDQGCLIGSMSIIEDNCRIESGRNIPPYSIVSNKGVKSRRA